MIRESHDKMFPFLVARACDGDLFLDQRTVSDLLLVSYGHPLRAVPAEAHRNWLDSLQYLGDPRKMLPGT